ncbi:MAG: Gfo/Idh/MocA family oxidoreductase [Deltaproteobacteria bacterium]|nr:Gfo/Idh/MocA family oxidoreductase [Deltaproteobacteria bacterium]
MPERSAPRVAVIGAGAWGKNLVRNFSALGALAAVVEPDPERREAVGRAYPGVALWPEAEAVLSDPDLAAVVISTPAPTHAELVARALAKGKHVFVEKPLCLDLDEGSELVRRAEGAGLVLMVGHILHYHPAVIRLKAMVDEGELGRLNYIYSNRLNLGRVRQEENIVWSFAPHDISVILALTGEMPNQVASHGGTFLQSAIADVTVSNLSFPSGVKAHIFVNWLHPFKEQKLVVVGEAGMAVFDDTLPADKLLFYPHKIAWKHRHPVAEKVEPVKVAVEAGEPLAAECAHFLDCVASGATPLTDGREGLAVLAVLDACQKSLDSGGVAHPGVDEFGRTQAAGYTAHPTALIDEGASIGQGTRIWHFAHVITGSRIGEGCSLGQNVVVGPRAVVGRGVKIQNNVSVFEGVTLEDHVFCGPSMVFTNVVNPRASISRKNEYRPTLVREGATLGANCTIVCGHTIGRHAFVAAGAVVTHDVPDYALVAGNPAHPLGWMCQCGERLSLQAGQAHCAACGRDYLLENDRLRPA